MANEKLHPDTKNHLSWFGWLGEKRARFLSSAQRSRLRPRDKLTDYLYLISAWPSRLETERAKECAWSKSRIYDSRNVHTTRAEEEIAEKFELGKEKQPNRFKSAFLVLCFSNIYQMSTKKIFERRASTRKKMNRLAANNYVKKGRELHLNLTLNVKVTAMRPKKPAVIYSNRCRRRARRSEESAGH